MNIGWNFRREHLRHPAALALRHPQRRRSAERRPAERLGLVLLPRNQLRRDQEAVGHRQQHGEGRHDDDRHRGTRCACSARRGRGTSTRPSPRRCTRTSRRSGCRSGARRTQTLAKAVQREMKVPETGLATKINPLRGREVDPRRGKARRRLGRHRRHLLERADGDAQLPVEHPGRPRAQLGERDLDGDADRAQGHPVRRQGRRADRDRSPDASRARHAGVGLLQQRADEGPGSTSR